jgi:hypothetical protein
MNEETKTPMKWWHSRWQFAVAIWFVIIFISIPYNVIQFRKLYTTPGYYPWPKVTQCSACKQTIFAWQRYDRRERPAPMMGNGTNYMISIRVTSLFHTGCETVPPEPITVNVQ